MPATSGSPIEAPQGHHGDVAARSSAPSAVFTRTRARPQPEVIDAYEIIDGISRRSGHPRPANPSAGYAYNQGIVWRIGHGPTDRRCAVERRLSAILAADVVGFASHNERDEGGTFERLRTHRKELFEPEIARHHGRIFKLMGDGLLAEFSSVVESVECAVALQRGMTERNDDVPADKRIDVRIGINLGDVIIEGEDRHGEGVVIASRLQQLAKPGGIAVSSTVME